MFCGFCGKENPDGAVYCMSCGKRLDGKKICPKCGKPCEEEAKFCPYCGASLTAPAPVAAPAYAPVASPVESEMPSDVPAKSKKSVFDILGICGGALAMASVLFSLIFVFCIGLETSVTRGSTVSCSIYDFFYDRYHDLDNAFSLIEKDGEPLSVAAYASTVICTIDAVAGFVLVVTLSVLAITKFAKQMQDGKPRNYFKYAVGAYVSFLAAACVFYAFASMGVNSLLISDDTEAMRAEISFNAATLSGIILGGIFLAVGAGLRLAARGKALMSLSTILNCSLAFAGAILAIIAFSFAKNGQIAVEAPLSSAGASFKLSPISACLLIGAQYIADTTCEFPIGELIVAILAAVAQIAVLAMLALKICSAAKRLDGKGRGNGVITSTVLLGVAILSLVLNVVFVPMFETYMYGGAESGLEFNYAAPIVVVVLSALMMAESIIAAAFTRRSAN